MALFGILSLGVYREGFPGIPTDLISAAWVASGAASVSFAALAILPWILWKDTVRVTGFLWTYALAAAVAASAAIPLTEGLWRPASRLTFTLVQLFLRPFVAQMAVYPEILRLGTPRFAVTIADQCSGLEGIGLLLAFSIVWLVLFRDEVRFPHALALVPAGLVCLFLLNAVRIAALILIGDAGARDIAMGGFHSQAGWIAFNSVAFGLCVAARRLPWISAHPARREASVESGSNAAAYLIPFLCILATGMISRAVSGSFEWFYGLRFFAALAALWIFRRAYSSLDWTFGWIAPAAGAAVFALWIALDRFAGVSSATATGMSTALAAAPVGERLAWILVRVLAAVVTVPISEELAFRGFLLRRFIAADFEAVSLRTFTWWSLVASSVLFGLMHGERWLAGTAAGMVYGAILLRRGKMGDAVAAHSTTNLLLAGYVLLFNQWQLW
jgi:exosortase E/protease (VPEID-CTERM system)